MYIKVQTTYLHPITFYASFSITLIWNKAYTLNYSSNIAVYDMPVKPTGHLP